MIPCEKVSTLPDVTLKLGGKLYKLSSEDYTLKVSTGGLGAGQGAGQGAGLATGQVLTTLAIPGFARREDHLLEWLHGHGHPPTWRASLDPG